MNIENKTVNDIIKDLEDGVREVFESDQYLNYLEVMSRFHNYSSNNWRLIYKQFPNATLLAGYQQWKEKFGRYVKRCEKGIKILAPYYKYQRLYGFKQVTVFDISQTAGKELPVSGIQKWNLENGVINYKALYSAIEKISPLPIVFEKLNGVDGKCFHGERIVINEGMCEAQNLLTMIHEIVHEILHNNNVTTVETKEVEAESIAYAVCRYWGIDTSKNSFGYIAEYSNNLRSWSIRQPMNLLKSSLETITALTKEIINKIKYELEIEDNIVVAEDEDLLMLYEQGLKYFDGRGVEQNYEKALEYFCLAGVSALEDEWNTPVVLRIDEGDFDDDRENLLVDEDSKRIFEWCLGFAQKGCCKSQFVVAYFYALGIGVDIDGGEAFEWYLKSAKQSYRPAQYAVGICYKYEVGAMYDEEEYVYWFTKAAETGDVRAQYLLGCENMYGVFNGADDRQAVRWFLEAAQQGHKEAQFELGICCYQGIGTEVDYKESFKWYEKAMKQGDHWARHNLVHFYFQGLVVDRDIEKGINLLLEAIDDGDTSAKKYLIDIVTTAVNDGHFNKPWHRFI